MMTSKYIAHFLTEVSMWQKKLSTADQVISIYMEVQRTWSHLESIFIGSEDIRKQLPEDSKRFDGIDTDFKVCLRVLCIGHNLLLDQIMSPMFIHHPSSTNKGWRLSFITFLVVFIPLFSCTSRIFRY